MKGAGFFIAGVMVGAALLRPGLAQDNPVRSLNHVGLVVRDYDAAMAYYTKTLGLREAYTVRRPDGAPQLISRARTRNPILTWASGTAPVIVRVGALWHTGKAWAILDAHQQLPQAHPPVVNRRT